MLFVLLVSSRARALDPQFGARGQVVVTKNADASISWTGYDSGATLFSANLVPSLDWFAWRNVSLGVEPQVGYASSHSFNAYSELVDDKNANASLGLRVGVNLPASRWVSFWLRGTVYLRWSQDQHDPTIWQTTSQLGTALTLFVPVLFQIRPHFFVGFGPAISHTFDYGLDGSTPPSETTTVSLHTIVGGYIGGEKDTRVDELPIHWRPFGEPQETVVDGSAALTWQTATNGGPSYVSSSGWVGVDHFVAQHVSIGVGAGVSYARSDGGSTTRESWSVYLAPRVGYDIPISPRFSFYPRAALGFGVDSYNLESGVAQNASTTLLIYVGAYAPILWHAAPHFFVGFGPSISRDLVNKDPSYPSTSNLSTTVGAALTVGGWL